MLINWVRKIVQNAKFLLNLRSNPCTYDQLHTTKPIEFRSIWTSLWKTFRHGKPLSRPPAKPKETPSQRYRKRKKAVQRNHIEAKFGQGKRWYGLNNIKAGLPEISESCIKAIFFVMNLTKLLQLTNKYERFFVPNLKQVKFWLKKVREFFSLRFFSKNLILFGKDRA